MTLQEIQDITNNPDLLPPKCRLPEATERSAYLKDYATDGGPTFSPEHIPFDGKAVTEFLDTSSLPELNVDQLIIGQQLLPYLSISTYDGEYFHRLKLSALQKRTGFWVDDPTGTGKTTATNIIYQLIKGNHFSPVPTMISEQSRRYAIVVMLTQEQTTS